MKPTTTHAAALALWACALPATAAPDWDILGIKLGMTEAQVRSALQAYDAKAKIIAVQANIPYSDKIKSYSSPSFLSRLEMRTTQRVGTGVRPQSFIRVWFSGPTGEARAIAVMRDESNVPNPPTGPQFLQSLVGKYGTPTANDTQNTPIWEEKGKPSCLWIAYGKDAPKQIDHSPFSLNLYSRGDFSQSVAALERRRESTTGERGVGLPADLKSCGAFLYYFGTTRTPAQSFNAAMFDVGSIVASQRSLQAWVQQLEGEAVRKREGQGQAPKL